MLTICAADGMVTVLTGEITGIWSSIVGATPLGMDWSPARDISMEPDAASAVTYRWILSPMRSASYADAPLRAFSSILKSAGSPAWPSAHSTPVAVFVRIWPTEPPLGASSFP